MSPNGYQKAKLEDYGGDICEMKADIKEIRKELSEIKLSLSFWKGGAAVLGALGGFVMSVILKYIKFQ